MPNYEVEVTQVSVNRIVAELEADCFADARLLAYKSDYEVTDEKNKGVVDTTITDLQCIDCEHGYKRGQSCPACEALEHGDQQFHLARDEGRL